MLRAKNLCPYSRLWFSFRWSIVFDSTWWQWMGFVVEQLRKFFTKNWFQGWSSSFWTVAQIWIAGWVQSAWWNRGQRISIVVVAVRREVWWNWVEMGLISSSLALVMELRLESLVWCYRIPTYYAFEEFGEALSVGKVWRNCGIMMLWKGYHLLDRIHSESRRWTGDAIAA